MGHAPLPDGPPALALRWICEPTGDQSRRIVATGVFDLLHVGHARFFAEARAAGTSLLVGVEADARVAARKGSGRPIVPASERGELVGALRTVDGVFLVDGSPSIWSPEAYADLMEGLRPSALALTAGDPAERGKRDAARRLAADVVVVAFVKGRSTTALLERAGPAAYAAGT